jgi:glycerol-3-phosphate O-acyltransferase
MQIYISDNAIIASIQRAFQAVYPYLKLEFYIPVQEAGQASVAVKKVSPETPIDDIRDAGACGWCPILKK